MADKRLGARLRKRIKVTFVENGKKRMGYTDDMTEDGLFLRTAAAQPPGTLVTIEIEMAEQEKIVVEGRVRWARRIPAQMVYKAKGGMGVKFGRFHSGEDAYRSFVEGLRRKR